MSNPLQPQGPYALCPPDLPTVAEDTPPSPMDTLDPGEDYLAGVLMQALHIFVGGEIVDTRF